MDSEGRYGVLVVEDETIAGRAHASYVSRLEQFHVVGIAKSASQALSALIGQIPSMDPKDIDLILLDMNLGDGHGIQLLRALRAKRITVDVIAVTASREIKVVHDAMSLGVMHYIIKPFTFPVFKAKLDAYCDYRASLSVPAGEASQEEIDDIMGSVAPRRNPGAAKKVPIAIQKSTVSTLRAGNPISATEAGELLGVSRVTARRYLEAMADAGILKRQPRYGNTGRPVLEYTLPE